MKYPPFVIKLLSERFRLLAIGVTAIIVGAGYVLFITTKIQTIQTTGFLQKQQVQAELATQRTNLQALQQTAQHFAAALPAEKLAAVDEFIPSSPDFPGPLLTINNIANAANLKLDSVSIGEVGQLAATSPTGSSDQTAGASQSVRAATASGVNLQIQDAAVTVTGGQSYASFKNFIGLLESSRRLLDVVSLGFNLESNNPGQSGQQNFTVHVRTYYLPVK